jgi:hypothetical protein
MAYKAYADRPGPSGPWCKRCVLPIAEGEASEYIQFINDPEGKLRDLDGLYHVRCAEPYASLARILNISSWGRF